jgi:hypothetical protein
LIKNQERKEKLGARYGNAICLINWYMSSPAPIFSFYRDTPAKFISASVYDFARREAFARGPKNEDDD